MLRFSSWAPGCTSYQPLDDVEGDVLWMPFPRTSAGVFSSLGYDELGYDVRHALRAWGVTPLKHTLGDHIVHPDDGRLCKFKIPYGWNVRRRYDSRWDVCDDRRRARICIRYDPWDGDWVESWLLTPIGAQLKVSEGQSLEKWWVEVSYHGNLVFKSNSIQRAATEIVSAEGWTEVEYEHLTAPLMQAARAFIAKEYPQFPADASAYW